MRFFHLLSELKRRRVYRVGAAYVVASFAVLEGADLILPGLGAPEWIYGAIVILVLSGFPLVLVLSWIFDITPEGIRRDGGESSSEPVGVGPGWTGQPLLVMTLVVGVVGLAAWFAGRRSARPNTPEPSSTLAIVPFASAVADSALERVGRELVITLSSSLAGTADIATAEPLAVLAMVRPEEGPTSLARAHEVAAALGADRLLHGGLLATEDGVRLEVSLYETRGLSRLGTQGVSASDLEALSDSATLAVLRLLWAESPSAPPSPGAISTGSPEALRAYLAGERALAEGRWREAPEQFARAIAADSAFWFAYWRLQYALEYYSSPVDSVVRARVWEHRHTLPERDRLLIVARSLSGTERLEKLRQATTRYPTYWPAWWDLSETLVHHGGYHGHGLDESTAALERTLALNPRFTSAWVHLFWIATRKRDDEAMGRIIEELSAARYDQVSLQESGINSLAYQRAQHALVQSRGEVPASVVELGVEELSSYRGPAARERMASSLTSDGFLAAQVAVSRGILSSRAADAGMRRAQHFILAHAWAAQGRWEPALMAADAYAASASEAEDLLLPYQVAVIGAWGGTVSSEDAAGRRPDPQAPVWQNPELAAELGWLDGLLALSVGSPGALARARRTVDSSGGPWREPLLRSLRAFDTALSGDTMAAARALVALERESAELRLYLHMGPAHPFLPGVHRLTAAHWLVEGGDALSARALLPWYETVHPGPLYRLNLANQVLATPALLLRAELARHAGEERRASAFEALYRERRGGAELAGAAHRPQPR